MTIIEVATPGYVAAMLVELSDCVCEQLSTVGAGPTCWCGLWHGQAVSWDYCGECSGGVCGMGWVRLVSIFPYGTFPVATVDLHCQAPLAAQVEVGAMRCLPLMEQDGSLPSAEVIGDAALSSAADAFALYRAVQCCTPGKELAVAGYAPQGPLGGCVGGAWQIFWALD